MEQDRRAPSAGFNRVRFQGCSLNPRSLTLRSSNPCGIPLAASVIILPACRRHDHRTRRFDRMLGWLTARFVTRPLDPDRIMFAWLAASGSQAGIGAPHHGQRDDDSVAHRGDRGHSTESQAWRAIMRTCERCSCSAWRCFRAARRSAKLLRRRLPALLPRSPRDRPHPRSPHQLRVVRPLLHQYQFRAPASR